MRFAMWRLRTEVYYSDKVYKIQQKLYDTRQNR